MAQMTSLVCASCKQFKTCKLLDEESRKVIREKAEKNPELVEAVANAYGMITALNSVLGIVPPPGSFPEAVEAELELSYTEHRKVEEAQLA